MPCPTCSDSLYPHYGLAPHTHDTEKTGGSFIGSTETLPRDQWPENFHEDPEEPGMGVWSCPDCDGQGRPKP